MGNYLLYCEDLAGIVALNLLLQEKHKIIGIIDCSGRLIELALQKGSTIYRNIQLLPAEALEEVDSIMIGVDTEPLAAELKKELTARFPQKKICTLLDPEYLPTFLALRQTSLQQLITDEPQVMPIKYGNDDVLVFVDNKAEAKRARKVLEKEVIAFMHSLIKPSMVIYDVGANIGTHSLILGRQQPNCQIHAFEPETLNYWKLLRNIGLNKLTNIKPHLIAAGAKREIRFLSLQGQISGLGQHSLQKAVSNLTTPVEVWDLDSYVKKKKAPSPNLAKIDVEGFELQVLKGMSNLLKTKKPQLIIEVHEALMDKVKLETFLKKRNYKFKEITHQKKRSFIYAYAGEAKIPKGKAPAKGAKKQQKA
jgi:FkbM family methyltransferase